MRYLLAFLTLACASCGGHHGAAVPQPSALTWADGAYVATYKGHALMIYIDGQTVHVGSADIHAAWVNRNPWWYEGTRPTDYGLMRVGLSNSNYTVRVQLAGRTQTMIAKPFSGNG